MSTYFELCCSGCTPYKPKVNRKKQGILASLIIGDIILPMTFGLGCILAKTITKFSPLFIYK